MLIESEQDIVVKKFLEPMKRLSLIVCLMIAFANNAFAASYESVFDFNLPENVLGIMTAITVISVIPILLIVVTSFTRIVIVLSFLRNAMGLQQTPPNSVIIALSIFLTIFTMLPTIETSYIDGIEPIIKNGEMFSIEKIEKITRPFVHFMLKNIKKEDMDVFLELAKLTQKEEPPFRVIAASFMISELKKSFEIGFLIFLPFVVIDLLVASILMSMGMVMLPPIIISLPFKIIFFVLIDGWSVISVSLIKGFIS